MVWRMFDGGLDSVFGRVWSCGFRVKVRAAAELCDRVGAQKCRQLKRHARAGLFDLQRRIAGQTKTCPPQPNYDS